MHTKISYRLDIKKWKVNKSIVSSRKSYIQSELRKKLGLIVDVPIPGGRGTSNDGNTARIFFNEYEVSSRITEIDMDLIKRLGVILKVINCRFDIDAVKFDQYCQETFKLYVDNYD